jgi:hypothetical protein
MFGKWVTASAAVAATVLGTANLASAAPQELMGVDANGNKFSSGWTWDVPAANAGQVDLVYIRAEGDNFFLEKDAVMTRAGDPLVIDFAPVAGATQMTLVINDEAVRNSSGEDWTDFRMVLSSPGASFAFATSDGSGGIGDFNIDPFTTFTFSSASDLLLSGGTVANGTTWFPGAGSNTGLALVAPGGAGVGFQLKEIANSTGTGPGPAIPLPASFWTGLSGLGGLGLLAAAKRVRKLA